MHFKSPQNILASSSIASDDKFMNAHMQIGGKHIYDRDVSASLSLALSIIEASPETVAGSKKKSNNSSSKPVAFLILEMHSMADSESPPILRKSSLMLQESFLRTSFQIAKRRFSVSV